MPKCRSLFDAAEANPAGLRFTELCQLAECFGWELARQHGSHRLYKRSATMRMMNFQDVGGRAKEYQVKHLLTAIAELGLELE